MREVYKELWEKSRAHLEKGELGMALGAVRDALELAPDDAMLWEELFKLSMLGGMVKNTLIAAFQLREIDGNNVNYIYMHGIASLVNGQVEEAAKILEHALDRAPGSLEIRRALAQAYEVLKQPDRVRMLLEEAVAQSPTHADAVNDLAVHYLGLPGGEGKPKAEIILRRLLDVYPDQPAANLNLAIALYPQDPEGARRHAAIAARSESADIRQQAERLIAKLG